MTKVSACEYHPGLTGNSIFSCGLIGPILMYRTVDLGWMLEAIVP